MTWFDGLTGFAEQSMDQVRANLRLEGTTLTTLVNNRSFDAGVFTTPQLSALRGEIEMPSDKASNIRIRELVGDVRSLHQDAANQDAVFQVASQFNCLEMASPHVTPEDGVGIYQNDHTQGPACSICAGAGTIVRNYFADANGQIGQTHDNQIDCLAEIGDHFDNQQKQLWKMLNGYCLPTPAGLAEIEEQLKRCSESDLDQLRRKLRVGVQSKTQVTLGDCSHRVTQVFCSALPIAYSKIAARNWNCFPRLILDATYEATFSVAAKNLADTGCDKLFLTLVGGGVFGNRLDWILSAIGRSLDKFASIPLDVSVVSYGGANPEVDAFVSRRRS